MKRTPLKRSTKLIARRTRVKLRRSKPRRVTVARDSDYLKELTRLYCTVGMLRGSEGCSITIDPAHGPVNGMSSKGSDYEAIPLCRKHHREQHALTWPAFEQKYGFSRIAEAAKLKSAWEGWMNGTCASI